MYEELKEILDKAQRIVFFGGAGVSTESGVPDFRSENGLYHAQHNYGRSPEEMLSIDFFESDPVTFFDYYKNNLIATWAKPNRAHKALAKLEEQGKLIGVVTQNIDGLHQLAGSRNVLELHGSTLRNYCLRCGRTYGVEAIENCTGVPKCACGGTIRPDVVLYEENCEKGVPKCSCGGTIKPDVVLYGEMLDDDCIRGAVNAISKADVLIIGGTSLVVYPAAGFVHYFKGDKLVILNKSETAADDRADLVIHDPIGEVLGECLNIE